MHGHETGTARGAVPERPVAEQPRRGGLLEPIPIATALLDADGRVLHWSEEAERLLGHPASVAVGSPGDLLLVPGDRRSEAVDLFDRIVAGRAWAGSFPLRHRDGHLVELEFRTYPVAADGRRMVLAVAADVRSLRGLEADRALLDGMFAQSPVGLAVYDAELRFLRVNAALARMNGLPPEAHVGRRLSEVLPGINAAEIEAVMLRVLETGEPVVDARSHGRTPGDPDEDHAWSAAYFRLEDPAGEVLGLSSSVVDVTERFNAEAQAARARARLAALADATARIGTTLDVRQTARELAHAVVPRFADVCGVYLLDRLVGGPAGGRPAGSGRGMRVRRLAISATHAGFPADALPVEEVYDLPPESPFGRAMATRRTLPVTGRDRHLLARDWTGRLAAFFRHDLWTMRVTPLVARGTVLGLVAYSRRGDREPFDDSDITLADELAARAAVSVDNARLYTREHDTTTALGDALREANAARERLSVVNEATTRIGTTLDVATTAQQLAEVAAPRLADTVVVEVLDAVVRDEEAPQPADGSAVLRRVAFHAVRGSGMTPVSPVGGVHRFDPSTPYAWSLARCRPVRVPRLDDAAMAWFAHDPARAEAARAQGVRSFMVLPLIARGVALGVVAFYRTVRSLPFDEDDLALATELVARAAVSLDNARLYRRERRTALTLQRSLLPQEVHRTLGLEIAHRYQPSSVAVEVGGDWFDVVPLSGGRVALVVGDVMGHGIRAAATMGQLRTAARTLTTLDLPPEGVLTRLDEAVSGLGEGQFATCVCAVYDPVEAGCAIACAGHPPPVLVRPDGSTELLDLPPGVPLGVGGAPFQRVDFTLSEGSSLVLYTDGLVEQRGRDIDEGIGRLREALARGRGPLEETCDEVLDVLAAPEGQDDIAMIMARVLPLGADRVATWPLRQDAALVGEARAFTRRTLAAWRVSSSRETAELLVSELVTNALLHAGAPAQLRLIRAPGVLVCEVADLGGHPPALRHAAEGDEGGRGMHLVNEMAHRWGTRFTRHGKVVWFELEIPRLD